MSLMFTPVILLASLGNSGPGPLCSAVAAVDPDRACAESTVGVVLAADQDRARLLLSYAQAGEAAFQSAFGRPPARYAVVESDGPALGEDRRRALAGAGFPVILPWLSPAGFRQQIDASIRRAVEAQTAGLVLSKQQIDDAVAPGVRQAGTTSDPAESAERDSISIPHELGHLWSNTAFWPDAGAREGHYGGAGPDWLDEAAAVRMEPAQSIQTRATGFWEWYRADPVAARTSTAGHVGIADLRAYFDSNHPVAAAAQALADQTGGGPSGSAGQGTRVIAITGPEAQRIAGDGLRYYQQGAIIVRYLVDRSGDPAILARIGAAFGRGETIDQWLANPEPKGNLPRSVAAMQVDWESWLTANVPAASPAP